MGNLDSLAAWREHRHLTLEEVGRKIGADKSTIQKIEAGKRKLTLAWMERLASIYGCTTTQLLSMPPRDNLSRSDYSGVDAVRGVVALDEVDVRAGAGGGGLMEDAGPRVSARWSLPAALLEAQTTARHDNIKIITVFGDSMEPTIQPGQRLMVDTSDRTPSPPGVFVLWDGLGTVVKRVEHLIHSSPPRVRIFSDNTKYQPYELTLDEIQIQGRVIGRWQWS